MDNKARSKQRRLIYLILSLLNGKDMTKFDISREATKKSVSSDSIDANLDKMVSLGLVISYETERNDGTRKISAYKKVDKVFCMWGCLNTPRPLAFFPCEFFFDCKYTGNPGEICKKMEWAISAVGITRLPVTRVFPNEAKKYVLEE